MASLSPDAWLSIRSRMPPHVAARHAAAFASRKPAITATASSPASAAHGRFGFAGWIGRGSRAGGFRFAREAARPPRLPRRASCVAHPSTPQNPARSSSLLARVAALGGTSKPAAWPKTSATATRPRASFGSNFPRRHSALGVHRVTRATARRPARSSSSSSEGRTSISRTAHSCMRRRCCSTGPRHAHSRRVRPSGERVTTRPGLNPPPTLAPVGRRPGARATAGPSSSDARVPREKAPPPTPFARSPSRGSHSSPGRTGDASTRWTSTRRTSAMVLPSPRESAAPTPGRAPCAATRSLIRGENSASVVALNVKLARGIHDSAGTRDRRRIPRANPALAVEWASLCETNPTHRCPRVNRLTVAKSSRGGGDARDRHLGDRRASLGDRYGRGRRGDATMGLAPRGRAGGSAAGGWWEVRSTAGNARRVRARAATDLVRETPRARGLETHRAPR